MSVGPVQRDAATAPFFDAAAAGQFLLRRCAAGHVSEPQAAQCTTCASTELTWMPAGGGATLVSWSVTRPRGEGGTEPEPTVLVIAEFDEGPWWWSQLDCADPAALASGQRLEVRFASAGDGSEPVPVFVLAGPSTADAS
jgi:uncharacterized OB-fold protein